MNGPVFLELTTMDDLPALFRLDQISVFYPNSNGNAVLVFEVASGGGTWTVKQSYEEIKEIVAGLVKTRWA